MRKSEQRENPEAGRRHSWFRPWMAGAATLATSLGMLGCSSIHSTHLERSRDCCGWKVSKLRGVPTKLRVPTHLEVKLLERRYAKKGEEGKTLGTLVYLQDEFGGVLRTHQVFTRVIEKEEIFLVDPVRPAAGLGYSSTELNEKNSVKLLKGKIEDQTIEAITYSLNKLAGFSNAAAPARPGSLPNPSGRSASQVYSANDNISVIESIVAARWFPLEDPQLEIHVHEFLRERLNGCRPPCSPPVQTEFGADPVPFQAPAPNKVEPKTPQKETREPMGPPSQNKTVQTQPTKL